MSNLQMSTRLVNAFRTIINAFDKLGYNRKALAKRSFVILSIPIAKLMNPDELSRFINFNKVYFERTLKNRLQQGRVYRTSVDIFILSVIHNYLFACGINKYVHFLPADGHCKYVTFYAALTIKDKIGCPIELTDYIKKLKTTRNIPKTRVFACPFCGLIRTKKSIFKHLENHMAEIIELLRKEGIIKLAAHCGILHPVDVNETSATSAVSTMSKIDYEKYYLMIYSKAYDKAKEVFKDG